MKEHIAQYGTVMESWFPLGGRGNTQTLFNDETISAIAAAHGKTSVQVILRWHLQAGNVAITGDAHGQSKVGRNRSGGASTGWISATNTAITRLRWKKVCYRRPS